MTRPEAAPEARSPTGSGTPSEHAAEAASTVSRGSRGMVRTRLLQARARAESDWAGWSDTTAARLIDLPPLARLRELRAHQADLTTSAWYRVAESLLRPDDGSATPAGATAVVAAPAEPLRGARGLPWDRRARNRARPQTASWADTPEVRPARGDAPQPPSGLPVYPPHRQEFPGSQTLAVPSRSHGVPARAASETEFDTARPPERDRAAPQQPRDQADTPDLMLGLLVLAGILLGIYWLFSERVL